ncbi:GntR family transcriptional regulator [Microbacterium invictum]|uniref:DNA-binding GntR family transcriptional regulator n=1 Tax=Microbacterium invictum TaxID=515415 RepID=A0AA40VNF2_9MICO|nr:MULTISPECIES: GntR family transcriptional regulator [Microbacterium]MBB4141301.1 DNA-binding GntR family transcriptional regulator [Microbacterium invictum]
MATDSRTKRPETLVSYAIRRIRTEISDGTIKPGARLSPHQLAPEYGLSHIPIREALASLAATGHVVHKQSQGYFSRELSAEDLTDIYHWREVLEPEAYTLAAPDLTDEDFAVLRGLIDQMAALTAPEQRFEYLELNREFHFVIFRRAGSDRLLRFLTYLWDSVEPYGSRGAHDLRSSEISHAEHLEMMPIIESRDPEKIVAVMDEHRQLGTAHVAAWLAGQD